MYRDCPALSVRALRTFRPLLEALEERWVPSTVPVLSSLPGAQAAIYLDFDGHFEANWGSYGAITSPAYSTDSDLNNFSSTELANIEQIWRHVAEDFAPFNINVTTVEPPSFANGVALRVVIGGDSAWTGGTYGGIAYINSFTSSSVNTVYVFPNHLGNGYPKYVGDAASHEAGHAFGTRHQSAYSGTTKTADYQSGPGDGTAPIMGNSYSAARSLWWYGLSTSSTTYQDDMAVIASATNGFGYRVDDHGNQTSATSLIPTSTGAIEVSGNIEKMTDRDWFSFTTGAGTVTFTADVPNGYNNLDAAIELYDSAGVLITSASPTNSFDASITLSVSGGSYYVVVSGSGPSSGSSATNYGFNVGAYSLVGSIVPVSGEAPAAPSSLNAAAVSASSIALTWTDNATSESGYRIERLINGVWTQVATVGANVTSWQESGLNAGASYSYRVRAYNGFGTSDYSNIASATTDTVAGSAPAAASNLTASLKTKPSLRSVLSWVDNSANESGFYVERSTDGGASWSRIATVGANTTSYSDYNVVKGSVTSYRVIAFNEFGSASTSNTAEVGSTTSGGNGKGAKNGPDAGDPLDAGFRYQTQVTPSWNNAPSTAGLDQAFEQLHDRENPAAEKSPVFGNRAELNTNVVLEAVFGAWDVGLNNGLMFA